LARDPRRRCAWSPRGTSAGSRVSPCYACGNATAARKTCALLRCSIARNRPDAAGPHTTFPLSAVLVCPRRGRGMRAVSPRRKAFFVARIASPMRDTAPTRNTPGPRSVFLSIFPSIMVPMFLAVIDQTIVATALPAIAASLGGVERISWVVIAYLVAGTVAAPVYGQLGDVFGRRRLIFVALAIFLAASLFCAFASSIEMLTLGRVLQGL